MKFFFLSFFAAGIVNHVLFANALPTPTVTSDVEKDPCTDRGKNEENRMGVYLGILQFGTVMVLVTMNNRTQEFCSKVPTLQHEITKFGVDVNHCLGKPQADLVNFACEAVSESLSFLCKAGGQNIDILFSDQAQQCEKRLKKSVAEKKLQACVAELYEIFFFEKIGKDICRTVKETELCSKRVLSEYCPEFTSFTTLHRDFFKSISKPCNRELSSSLDTNEV